MFVSDTIGSTLQGITILAKTVLITGADSELDA